MKKPAIPGSEPTKKNIQAIAQIVDIITGRAGVKIAPLAANATLADIVAKVNEVIELLQG
jgi:hypothetical protein